MRDIGSARGSRKRHNARRRSPPLHGRCAGFTPPCPPLPSPDAKDLRRDPKLRLVPLVADFKLAAKTYAATHVGKPTSGAAFFARMEFSRSKNLFGRLGIKALPYVARIPPSLSVTEGGAVILPSEEVLSTSSYPWSAEQIAGWVAERSGLPVGEVVRAPLVSARCVGGCMRAPVRASPCRRQGTAAAA